MIDPCPVLPMQCVVCRTLFTPNKRGGHGQRSCASKECKRTMERNRVAAWYQANKSHHKAKVCAARRRRKEAAA